MANAETRIAILATLLMMTLAAPSDAQTRSVIGPAGILGEWELTATLIQETEGGRWKGPLSLKHVGFCSADGPEEKTGELRLSMSVPPSEATATLLIDGEACTFRGRLTDGYDGLSYAKVRKATSRYTETRGNSPIMPVFIPQFTLSNSARYSRGCHLPEKKYLPRQPSSVFLKPWN